MRTFFCAGGLQAGPEGCEQGVKVIGLVRSGAAVAAILMVLGAAATAAPPVSPSYFHIAPPGIQVTNLTYAPAPPDNPLKGFVPYQSTPGRTTFPHSMSIMCFPMRDLMTGPSTFVWTSVETQIRAATNDGCHFVFRVYLDFPGKSTGIPRYLLDGGLTTYSYSYDGGGVSPDWEDATLRAAMTNFIAALGARYDGDPRIAAVEVGLLCNYGEWYSRPSVPSPSTNVCVEVMTAYTNAFHTTKILTRTAQSYTLGHVLTAIPSQFATGWHDDGFAYNTLSSVADLGFMLTLTNGGCLTSWQTQMIGGEVYPPNFYCMWDVTPCTAEDYSACVDTTHASWMMNSGVFSTAQPLTDPQRVLAMAGAHRLGYEFQVISLSTWTNGTSLMVEIRMKNTGVAPFYYDWPIELAAATSGGTILKTWSTPWVVSGILPGAPADFQMSLTNAPSRPFTLLMHVINPLPSGKPLRFANANQDATRSGWLTLGVVQ